MKINPVLLSIFIVLYLNTFAQASIHINEFMASNVITLSDEDDDFNDWIELYNSSNEAIDVGGFYLSDDESDLTKWKIPSSRPDRTTITPAGYLIIWADDNPSEGLLHAGFKLSKDSEHIILYNALSSTIIDSVNYGSQFSDISFCRFPDGASQWGYSIKPSPGKSNYQNYSSFTGAPVINENSGFYSGPISVTIIPQSPADEIYYTLDGSDPDETSINYYSPVEIDQTSVLRVRSIGSNRTISELATRSYFINSSHHLPVISIVTDPDNLFSDSLGIYANPLQDGRNWERKVTFEFIEQGKSQFNTFAGLRIQGNTGRKMAKKSFRLFFREGYGAATLNYPLFENTNISEFTNLVLRGGYDDDLKSDTGSLVRDPLVTELWRRFGYITSHSHYAILYLNGAYWGIYDMRESVNQYFIESYVDYSDFDIIRHRN